MLPYDEMSESSQTFIVQSPPPPSDDYGSDGGGGVAVNCIWWRW
jgi:hypothetical protein